MAGRRHHSAYFFFSTLPLSLLTSTAVMRPVAGDMCDGLEAELHKEVALACPLDVNIYDTKHSIVIRLYKVANKPEDVLGCDWLSSSQKFDCLRSRVDAKLIRIESGRVLARLTKDRLKNGTYRCQLVPPSHDPFLTDCDICYPVKDNPTTLSSVIPSTTADHHGSNGPGEKAYACADGRHGYLVAVVLSIIVLCQLLAMVAMVGFFFWYRRRILFHKKQKKTVMNGSVRPPCVTEQEQEAWIPPSTLHAICGLARQEQKTTEEHLITADVRDRSDREPI